MRWNQLQSNFLHELMDSGSLLRTIQETILNYQSDRHVHRQVLLNKAKVDSSSQIYSKV